MPTIRLETVTAEAFEPFGWLLPAPSLGDPAIELIKELENGRSTAKPRLTVTAVAATALPITATKMERHIHSSQAFMPFDCESYLVLVAPHGENEMPDEGAIRAFKVPGHMGINYRADTWHYPVTALVSSARFVILTFVVGDKKFDEQFVDLVNPVVIEG
jgi:ureidoglycolate lyase